MPLSVTQLRTVPTRSETLQWYLAQLGGLGFGVDRWADDSNQLRLLRGLARVTSNFAEIGKQIVEMCFNDLARGAALEAYSIARFGNTPKPATKAKHSVILTNVGTVPHTVAVGQLLLATKGGVQFRNTTAGTVRAGGGTLSITAEAIKKGSAGNVPGDPITVLLTPLAGVSATSTLLSTGTDPELDSALRRRNNTQWARLSTELIRDAYINIALEAADNIRRAEVNDTNPRGAGTIDVYVAGDSGPVGDVEIEAAQNYFAKLALQTEGYPANPTAAPTNPNPTRVLVLPAEPAFVDVTGTVYYGATYSEAAIQQQAEAAIRAYVARAPIGGYPYPSPGNALPKNNLENAMLAVPGVRTVSLTSPSGDVLLNGFSVATIRAISLTYVEAE